MNISLRKIINPAINSNIAKMKRTATGVLRSRLTNLSINSVAISVQTKSAAAVQRVIELPISFALLDNVARWEL
jgi:hypothetical protein